MNSDRGSDGYPEDPHAKFMRRFEDLYRAAGNPTLKLVAAAAQGWTRATDGPGGHKGASGQQIGQWRSGRLPPKFESLRPILLTLFEEARKSTSPTEQALVSISVWERTRREAAEWNAGKNARLL